MEKLNGSLEKLSDSEEVVMRCIWECPQAQGLADIVKGCGDLGKSWKTQTVSTFLARLVQKGYLESQRQGRSYLYYAKIGQEEYLSAQMSDLVNFWGKKSVGALMSAFGRTRSLSREDLKELRDFLDELDE